MSVTGQMAIRELSHRNPVHLEEFFGAGDSPAAVEQLRRILAAEPRTFYAFDAFDAPRPTHRRALVAASVAVVAGAAAGAAPVVSGTTGGPTSAPAPTRGGALGAASVAVGAGAPAVATTVLPGTPGGPTSAAASVLSHEAR